ncbi:MAG: phage major capsid protein [Thermomicrobiales bacterium]|nr:phage major capsid protein [Thermomicrobiales bacterium]MCO5226213.1 phage major capsid protein [Thermomicrobiales bacterium]MCO5228315.1 phage major capsid protein [Thermomicrobiales bacterium]
MAITKVEAAKLSNDLILRGVIETVIAESHVLNYLPFMQVTGTSVTYNRESSMPAAAFYVPGDTWTEATPTFTQHIAQLAILGGDADVDNFLQATYADTNDIEAEVIANRAKSVAYAFSDSFFNGDTSVNVKNFDGLHKLISAPQTVTAGANGAALTLGMMDELIDRVQPGKPDLLFMSKRTRRKLKDLRRSSGNVLETGINQFGQQVEFYDGIPLVVDDFIKDDRTLGSGNNLSTIYAVRFGQGSGVMGLEHNGIAIERVGELETKDATRTRIKWYCGLALFNTIGAAKLEGIV